jgi:hypothetical protein
MRGDFTSANLTSSPRVHAAKAQRGWLLRTVISILLVVFVVFPAIMIFAMHTHLEDLSFGDSMSSVLSEIKVGFKQTNLRTSPPLRSSVIDGTGGRNSVSATKKFEVRDLVAKLRAEQVRREREA